MTRIALIGDVHVTQSKNKEFEAKRFLELCSCIGAKGYDEVIFMGDLFDKARPSLEEIDLVRKGLSLISANKIVIDGNHEAVSKYSSTYDYIDIAGLSYKPFDKITIEGFSMFLLGYKNINNYITIPKCDFILSHFRSNFGIIKEEINVQAIANKASLYTFLGDIHQCYSPMENVYYTSSPYGIHFSKEQHKHGYIELNIDGSNVAYERVTLDLPTKVILDMTPDEIVNNILKLDTRHLYRIRVTGSPEQLDGLPQIPNIQFITQLTLVEAQASVEVNTDILESLIALVGEHKEVRNVLTQIYKEL